MTTTEIVLALAWIVVMLVACALAIGYTDVWGAYL